MAIKLDTQFIDQQFTYFEDFCAQMNGFDLDFRQLSASTGQHRLMQFASPELVYMRTLINSSFDQRGSTLKNMRTFCLLVDEAAPPTWCKWNINKHSLIIKPRHGDFTGTSTPGFHLHTFSINEEMIREIAELQFGTSWNKLHDESGTVFQLDGTSIARLRMTLNAINHQLLSSPKGYLSLDSRFLSRKLAQELVTGIAASKAIRLSKPDNKREKILTTARDYIEVNYDEYLSIKQLCSVAGTSHRTLEYIFQEKYQISPKAFLTARRLHAARQQLLSSRQTATAKIVDIANQYGFWHLGQFAKDYRSIYGELPSQTLKKPSN
jgi:AraC family ethanolamine operon transcriptional activator